jgi:hypothetical protein
VPRTITLKGATLVVDVFKEIRIINVGTVEPSDIKCDIVTDIIVEDSLGKAGETSNKHIKQMKPGGIYQADVLYCFSPSSHESAYDDDCDVTVENIVELSLKKRITLHY